MGIIIQKVALEEMRFFAYHGFYPEEQIIGCEFLVNVETKLEVFNNGNDDLSQTVNYEKLYTIVADQMKVPRKLIETVAHSILQEIRHEFISVKYINVVIRKMHPPLTGQIKNSLIELTFNR